MTQVTGLSVKDEATQLLKDVVARLSGSEPDVALSLRTAAHVCNLMGWADPLKWLTGEIKGYANAETAPEYRRVVAYETWRPDSTRGVIEQAVMKSHGYGDNERKRVPWILTGGIESLLATAEHGRIVNSGPDEERYFGIKKRAMMGRLTTIVDAQQAQNSVQKLRNTVFEWASRNYAALQLGDIVGDIFSDYRSRVDARLSELGLTAHLEAISGGLTSSNPQDWRQATYGVRDALRDLAKHLWQVNGDVYPFLENDDGKPIRVTEDKYVNRLWAYLHAKGVTGSTGVYLRALLRWLHALDDIASKAHEGVTLEEARMTVVGLYTAIGELSLRTDMQPLTTIEPKGEAG
ncbi:MAG: hypothetical protein WD904_12870 [Dehalococcoidia bacterium]